MAQARRTPRIYQAWPQAPGRRLTLTITDPLRPANSQVLCQYQVRAHRCGAGLVIPEIQIPEALFR
jgi:hypothetical protein